MEIRKPVVLSFKDGRAELSAEVISATASESGDFRRSLCEILSAHQEELMADQDILEPPELDALSCIVSRDPLPVELHQVLQGLGFERGTGHEHRPTDRSVFSRFRPKGARTGLDRWLYRYLRAEHLSRALGAIEARVVETVGADPEDRIGAARQAVVDEAAAQMEEAPTLRTIEAHILEHREGLKGRWILHPSLVLGVAGLMASEIGHGAGRADWVCDEDGENTITVRYADRPTVHADPIRAVIRFVIEGPSASLTEYVSRH